MILLAVKASLRWDIRRLALLAAAGMLAVQFVERHALGTMAQSGDGEKAKAFAHAVGTKIGNDCFAVYRVSDLATECYLGRFGLLCSGPQAVRSLPGRGAKWLITTDRAVLETGPKPATAPAPQAGPQLGPSPLDLAIDAIGDCEYRSPDRVGDKRGQGGQLLLIRIKPAGR